MSDDAIQKYLLDIIYADKEIIDVRINPPEYLVTTLTIRNQLKSTFGDRVIVDDEITRYQTGTIDGKKFIAKIGCKNIKPFLMEIKKLDVKIKILFTHSSFTDPRIPPNEFDYVYKIGNLNKVSEELKLKYPGFCLMVSVLNKYKSDNCIISVSSDEFRQYRQYVISTGKIPYDDEFEPYGIRRFKALSRHGNLGHANSKILIDSGFDPNTLLGTIYDVVNRLERFIVKKNRFPQIDDDVIMWALWNEYVEHYNDMRTDRKKCIEKNKIIIKEINKLKSEKIHIKGLERVKPIYDFI